MAASLTSVSCSPLKNVDTSFSMQTLAIDALSYTPTETQSFSDLRRNKATGRRSWKTLKGRPGLSVWNPMLEQALLDGLAEYDSDPEFSPKPSKHGFRFPNRNHYLSQFILERTGVLRTDKQISSRLQHLRDTCQDSTILHLLLGTHRIDASEGIDKSTSSLRPIIPEMNVKQVDIIGDLEAMPHAPCLDVIKNTSGINLEIAYLEPMPSCNELSPRSVHAHFSKTLQLFSSVYLNPKSDFVLYDRGQEVRRATTYLRQTTSPCLIYDTWVYECAIPGSLWKRLSRSPDLSSLTIQQRLYIDNSQPLTIVHRFDVSGPWEDNLALGLSMHRRFPTDKIYSKSYVTWENDRSLPY
ncbi:hypothetical protein DFP72DRAFT_1064896 [Ephemerocybe angulata]|uniref:TEA domain-containing protein n=1 Tax=Ephemerocybe angulata TaxID=980116 RepID=A0A8H6I5B5_9AGAR|nr:hypothetical protein DFP72DRAFT_1064896 [Tulosesus angulatus]